MVLLACTVSNPAAVAERADSLTITDGPPARLLGEAESFMGMPLGAFVRVKCTEPAIELNNARLLAIGKDTITVASVNGERFTLPKQASVVEDPVNWQRTTGVLNEPPRSRAGSKGWVVPLLVLASAGVVGGFWLSRRREKLAEEVTRKPITASAIPAEAPPPPKPESESDLIENLIESRCYGTAIERLEQQIKLQPDDFKLRLQLLKVYSIIGNRKQVDRVLRQTELHPAFSAEQKQQARQSLSSSKSEAVSAVQTGSSPAQKTAAAPQQCAG